MTSKWRFAVLGATTLVACTSASTDTKNQVPIGTSREAYTAVDDVVTTSSFVPRSIDNSLVTVVVLLDGAPVAHHQEALGRRLSRAEKDTIKAARLSEQTALHPRITALGGHVLANFQSALNGIKVEIPRKQIAALRALPGVTEVRSVTRYERNNIVSVPRIHAPDVWAGVFGLRGEGIKIAVIDTGIDYTHAMFGGPGTVDAWNAAKATNTAPADPALFGPEAPKVKGGTDLAGDGYDANGTSGSTTPTPDPNPLDCNGHGSHVAGTAAGLGVLADGTTYSGPYDPSMYTNNDFAIGPGVAPKADIYSVRVFGCAGSTNLVSEALEWAVDNDMDVVNMSLGSPFGTANDADSLAADNAAKAGVIVVAAAGNNNDVRYIAGGPGHSSRTIGVAASDAPASNPGATIALGTKSITAIDADGVAFADGTSYTVKVLRNADGSVSLGCNPAEYVDVAGKLVVTARGTCGRVDRAIYGQKAGAAAVLMVNNAAGLPPFEGKITQNPDTGELFTVTIPFFGVSGPASSASSDGAAVVAADGQSVSFTNKSLPTGLASFTSGGPRNGDSVLKPDVTAPGIAIVSTAMGTGSQGVASSGTSMATPHVAGVAALTLQAHPKWKPAQVKAAIINSGDPATLADYATRRAGSGLVDAARSARTNVYAEADSELVSVNFGLQEFGTDLSKTKTIHLHNTGTTAATFAVGFKSAQGSPHAVTFSASSVTVPPRGQASVDVTVAVPAATAGDASAFRDVAGLVTFTPTSDRSNFGVGLTVPYYLVPRVSSQVRTVVAGKLRGSPPTGSAVVDNTTSLVPATADFYAWGLTKDSSNLGQIDLRAAGVQTFGSVAAFAINTYQAWSTASTQEIDVDVDTNADGAPDYVVVGIDLGFLQTQNFNGQIASAVFNVATGKSVVRFLASTSTDTSSIVLPFNTADVALSATSPRFSYNVASFDLFGTNTDTFPTTASFNAFSPAISTGQFVQLDPNGKALVDLSVDPTEFAQTPALGVMVVTPDNKNGPREAMLEKVRF